MCVIHTTVTVLFRLKCTPMSYYGNKSIRLSTVSLVRQRAPFKMLLESWFFCAYRCPSTRVVVSKLHILVWFVVLIKLKLIHSFNQIISKLVLLTCVQNLTSAVYNNTIVQKQWDWYLESNFHKHIFALGKQRCRICFLTRRLMFPLSSSLCFQKASLAIPVL